MKRKSSSRLGLNSRDREELKMIIRRLDGPFSATRQQGFSLPALMFDILTLPLQISNTLTGVPAIVIPNFRVGAPEPKLPTDGVGIQKDTGIQGTFSVEGGGRVDSIGVMAIVIGDAKYASVNVKFLGSVKNVGNTAIYDVQARLYVRNASSYVTFAYVNSNLGNLNPGQDTTINLTVAIYQSDPAGNFDAILEISGAPVSIFAAAELLGSRTSSVLGNIEPIVGISIIGAPAV